MTTTVPTRLEHQPFGFINSLPVDQKIDLYRWTPNRPTTSFIIQRCLWGSMFCSIESTHQIETQQFPFHAPFRLSLIATSVGIAAQEIIEREKPGQSAATRFIFVDWRDDGITWFDLELHNRLLFWEKARFDKIVRERAAEIYIEQHDNARLDYAAYQEQLPVTYRHPMPPVWRTPALDEMIKILSNRP